MSSTIAPLPGGMGVSIIADQQHRRDRDGHQDTERPAKDDSGRQEPETAPPPAARGHQSPPPAWDDATASAATVFTVALLANELPRVPPSADDLKLRAKADWLPPDSPLRLRDKLI